jgi:predicted transcriptional regulator of viral defense system
MANKSRFVIAESSIKAFFASNEKKVYSAEELNEVLTHKRQMWNLPATMQAEKFIERLVNNKLLAKRAIAFEGTNFNKERYLVSDASVFQVAASLINKSFLSHYTAAYLHGLTNQIPKTIYISHEQSKKIVVQSKLKQTAVDSAFSKPQRKSGVTTKYDAYTFMLHNGMHSNRAGVFTLEGLAVTNLERTLIDIAVRPNYAGGVHSILDIYRRAIHKISINKLVATLDKLKFIYPYHQAIGYYLQKAGATEIQLAALHDKQRILKFYLCYDMKEKEYNSKWKIYHPKGM